MQNVVWCLLFRLPLVAYSKQRRTLGVIVRVVVRVQSRNYYCEA